MPSAAQGLQFPALFNENWLKGILNEFDNAFDVPDAVYPYNVVAVMDKNGSEIKAYEIEVALAGIDKENIAVKVRDKSLQIEIQPKNDPHKGYQTFLRKGISQRRGKISFQLSEKVSLETITSSYKDGLLRVIVPALTPKTVDIDVEVA